MRTPLEVGEYTDGRWEVGVGLITARRTLNDRACQRIFRDLFPVTLRVRHRLLPRRRLGDVGLRGSKLGRYLSKLWICLFWFDHVQLKQEFTSYLEVYPRGYRRYRRERYGEAEGAARLGRDALQTSAQGLHQIEDHEQPQVAATFARVLLDHQVRLAVISVGGRVVVRQRFDIEVGLEAIVDRCGVEARPRVAHRERVAVLHLRADRRPVGDLYLDRSSLWSAVECILGEVAKHTYNPATVPHYTLWEITLRPHSLVL
mmetsp:Transcript_87450/g.248407  ORF Transcript_87450/g.248407 Transcript_87450/m.248407 type:complete len:259 (-) Transcript_87450:1771-2547(-)